MSTIGILLILDFLHRRPHRSHHKGGKGTVFSLDQLFYLFDQVIGESYGLVGSGRD